jgi:CheY-like chemotaxis protein
MAAAAEAGVYMQAERKVILCLCYDTNMLQVRQMLLEHFGYVVVPTSSVEAAGKIAEKQCPDMLLIDNGHPDVDFEKLAAQIKRRCPNVIAVVLSPFYYSGRNGNGMIDRFVAKDDGPAVLISQIEELFHERGRGNDRPVN